MNDEHAKYMKITKGEAVQFLIDAKAREKALCQQYDEQTATLHKLEEDLARKTSDLELSMRRELELRKGNESLVNQRTNALNDAESFRRIIETERRRADQEKALREQMEQRLADMLMMVDVVKMVAGRE